MSSRPAANRVPCSSNEESSALEKGWLAVREGFLKEVASEPLSEIDQGPTR